MDIQIQKSIIIEQFNKVTDINLINAIKSMLDYGLNKEELTIPKEHQDIVIDRFEKSQKKPERLLDWDEAKETLLHE